MTMHPAAADLAAHLIDPEGRPQSILLASQRDKIRTALERAHHALATLHGGTVYDGDAEEGEVIDETETLAAIDAALRLVPEGPAVLRVVNPSTLDPARSPSPQLTAVWRTRAPRTPVRVVRQSLSTDRLPRPAAHP